MREMGIVNMKDFDLYHPPHIIKKIEILSPTSPQVSLTVDVPMDHDGESLWNIYSHWLDE